MSNKKPLVHPNLHPVNAMPGYNSGNKNFSGGAINLFGIQLDVEWNSKEESWEFNNQHIVDDEMIRASLHSLFDALDGTKVYEVFSDESVLTMEQYVRNKELYHSCFYDEAGRAYTLAKEPAPTFDGAIGIRVVERGRLIDEVKVFSLNERVWVYPKEGGMNV
jgi:hypothetical protein